jgi:mRNA-degrading endonuclease YafQ of YafQ-DinJ toxin-antitoxin module
LYEHCTRRNLKSNTHKNNWIKQLIALELRPLIEVIEYVDITDIFLRERHWISFYRNDGHNLTNTTDGGDGSFGYKMNKESVQKSLDTRRSNGSLKRSNECRKRISLSQKGKKHSEEQTEYVANLLRKRILQCDLDHNVVKEWKGIRKCARELKLDRPTLRYYLDKNIPYKGFIWKRQT